jgi:uncharacterized protein YdhG (YjbR/CyaY superfamily)
MERNAYKTVDEYLKTLPADKRAVLKKLRETIKASAPKAEEKISYMIPAYIYHGKPLVYFAAQKNFCSFYAVGKTLLKEYKKELAGFEVSNTTIHFTPEHPLPASLVKKLVKERMKQNEALGKTVKKPVKKTADKKQNTVR